MTSHTGPTLDQAQQVTKAGSGVPADAHPLTFHTTPSRGRALVVKPLLQG